MAMELVRDEPEAVLGARLKVLGVGGAGCNAVIRMVQAGLYGVDFVLVNTDQQVFERVGDAHGASVSKVRIGTKVTRGLGAGGNPEFGKKAAEEDKDIISQHLQNTDMLFITGGMGGGTGTGAAPVVAKLAKEMGILTVAIVSKPFMFEGTTRLNNAEAGIEELRTVVDTLIVIPNDKIFAMGEKDMPFAQALARADEILFQATQAISDLITQVGEMNVDFADVKSVLEGSGGNAIIGIGIAKGEDRATEAAKRAISHPLMDNITINGSKAVLVNFCGNISASEINQAATFIHEQAGSDAKIKYGFVPDIDAQDEFRVTVIASGVARRKPAQRIPTAAQTTQRILQSSDMFAPETQNTRTQPRVQVAEPQREYNNSAFYEEERPFERDVRKEPAFIPSNNAPQQPEKPAKQEIEEDLVGVAASVSDGLWDFAPDDYDLPAYKRRGGK